MAGTNSQDIKMGRSTTPTAKAARPRGRDRNATNPTPQTRPRGFVVCGVVRGARYVSGEAGNRKHVRALIVCSHYEECERPMTVCPSEVSVDPTVDLELLDCTDSSFVRHTKQRVPGVS